MKVALTNTDVVSNDLLEKLVDFLTGKVVYETLTKVLTIGEVHCFLQRQYSSLDNYDEVVDIDNVNDFERFMNKYSIWYEWCEYRCEQTKPAANDNQANIEELTKQIRQIYVDAHDNGFTKDWSCVHEISKTRFRAIAKHFATPSSTLQQPLTETLKSELELRGYLREIGKIFGKKVGVDIGVQDVVGLVTERYKTRGKMLQAHGVCEECGKMYSHDITEPFAHCGCGTSEWYDYTPFMKLQKKIHELESKSVDKLTVQEVAELFMKLTDTNSFLKGKEWGLINNGNHEEIATIKPDLLWKYHQYAGSIKLTDEQREELRKSMVDEAQLSGEVSVGYRIDLDSVDFGFDMAEKPDVTFVTYRTPEPTVIKTRRVKFDGDREFDSFVLEEWSNGELTVNNLHVVDWIESVSDAEPIAELIKLIRNLK